MGKSTISMVIFNSYVKLPEGTWSYHRSCWCSIQCWFCCFPSRSLADLLQISPFPYHSQKKEFLWFPWRISRNHSQKFHPVQFQFSSIAFPGFYPIGSMVLLYMVTWIPSIYPLYVSIYTSTMDPSWVYMLQQTRIPLWDDPQVITTVTVTVTDRMAWHKKTTNDWWNDRHRILIWILIWFYIWWRLHWWLLSLFLVALTVLSSSSHTYIAIAKSMAFLQISELHSRHLPSRAPQDWRQTVCWRSRGRWAEASSTCLRIYPGNSPPNDSSVIL